MIWLTKDEILQLHDFMIEETGGMNGIRDEGLLDSAIYLPLQTFEGMDLYPTLIDKIARLSYSLVRNHPFIDGNKRIGAFCLFVLLKLNAIKIDVSNQEIIETFLKIASSVLEYEDFLSWIKNNCKKSS